jgi:hypothetical protein
MQSTLLAASVHRHSRQLSKRPLLQLECQSYQRRLRRAAHNLQNNQRGRAGQARRVTYHFGFVGGCVESLVCFFEWRRKIRRNRVEQDLHAFVFVAGNTVTSHENRYNTSSAPQQRTHALPIRTGTKAVLTVARLMAASSCELVGSLSDKKMSPCWFITREIYKLKRGNRYHFFVDFSDCLDQSAARSLGGVCHVGRDFSVAQVAACFAWYKRVRRGANDGGIWVLPSK